jgi:hypothetical protein
MNLDSIMAELGSMLSVSEQRCRKFGTDYNQGYHAGLSAAVGVLKDAAVADVLAAVKTRKEQTNVPPAP